MIKWQCKTCGSLLDERKALTVVVSGFFTPVKVDDEEVRLEPRQEPRQEKPRFLAKKPVPKEEYKESEDADDLRLEEE